MTEESELERSADGDLERWQRAKEIIPGGNHLLSKRPEILAPDQWPAYYSEASGVTVTDSDGNEYTDMSHVAVGAAVLGYADEEVNRTVHEIVDKGSVSSLNPPETLDLAEKLLDLHPWADRVKFGRMGGEAMAQTVRFVRATSGIDTIAFCGYHGWHDWYLAANLGEADNLKDHLLPDLEPAGVPEALAGTIEPFAYNDAEELAAYTDVMREESVETAVPDADPVDCGANYDGKGRSAIFGVAAGLVSAAAGTPVVAHSGDRVPTQKQDAYRHVLDELGVRTDLDPEESAAMTDEVGFGFYYRPNFAPEIEELHDRRDQMGVRTFLNTIETLANPANASVHLGSFYHLPYARRIIDTFRESETATVDRVVMFQGMEGYDDVRPGSTKVAVWEAGEELEDFDIETPEYGMDFESEDLRVADVAADSAAITESVLAGAREDEFADAVAVNAALRIYAGGGADDIGEGLEQAREALGSGAAAKRLDALRAF
jgi:anthranilate phosphoribosyltransferase